jgi:hypothetical protein
MRRTVTPKKSRGSNGLSVNISAGVYLATPKRYFGAYLSPPGTGPTVRVVEKAFVYRRNNLVLGICPLKEKFEGS